MIDPRAAIDVMPFAWDNGVPTPGRIPCEIDETAYVGPFAVVQMGNARATRIGARTHVDAHAHIGHDVLIGSDCTIVAGTILCGHVTVEANAYIGAGARVRQRLRIGADSFVGMGAVVVKDVPPNVVVYGNPAREVRLRWPSGTDCRGWKWDVEKKVWRPGWDA